MTWVDALTARLLLTLSVPSTFQAFCWAYTAAAAAGFDAPRAPLLAFTIAIVHATIMMTTVIRLALVRDDDESARIVAMPALVLARGLLLVDQVASMTPRPDLGWFQRLAVSLGA